jgi:spore germination cell wall hydrolase CwlJ-like protein
MIKKTIVAAILMTLPILSQATSDKTQCLARIIYSEARGEPLAGQLAVAHAVINRSHRSDRHICRVKGVTALEPSDKLKPFFYNLARLSLKSASTIGTADSWNVKKIPHDRGKKVKKIGAHIFYIMSKL